MEVSPEIITTGVASILAAGVAFGIVKGKMYNYVTYDKHREICNDERARADIKFNKLFEAQTESRDMIKEIHGYLKAKNGGSL